MNIKNINYFLNNSIKQPDKCVKTPRETFLKDAFNEIGYGIKLLFTRDRDVVQIGNGLKAEKVVDKADKCKYFKVYLNELYGNDSAMKKTLNTLQSWLYSIGTNKKFVRIFKNEKGEVVGGYINRMCANREMNITEIGLRKQEKSTENIKGICLDIKKRVEKKNPKEIFVLMANDSHEFIDVFKKLGFKTHDKADIFRCDALDDLTQMSIKTEDFLKNFSEKLSVIQ